MSEIRLRYSGYVMFISNIISIATGLMFTIMVTRNVSIEDFGILSNINDLITYFGFLAGIIPFWSKRFMAKGYESSAKTSLVINSIISIIVVSVYLGLTPAIMHMLGISKTYILPYLLISVLILENYIKTAIASILHLKKPQAIGYGLMIHEFIKIIAGCIFIMLLKMGVVGAIYSFIVAYFSQIVFYLTLTADEFKGRIKWDLAWQWFKGSTLNLFNVAGNRLMSFPLILLFVYGGEIARAYYGAARTIAINITYSWYLAFAMYPKLLMGGKSEDVVTSLKMVLMFGIPMTIGAITLSDSLLIILKSDYVKAKLVLIPLSICMLFRVLSWIFDRIVMGTEKLEDKAKLSFKKLIQSNTFAIFSLSYIQSAIAIPTTYFFLTSMSKTPLESAVYVSGILFVSYLLIVLIKYKIARKCFTFYFPWMNVIKYLVASVVMSFMLMLIPHPKRLSRVIACILFGATIYLMVLSLIDRETLKLIKLVIKEIKSRL